LSGASAGKNLEGRFTFFVMKKAVAKKVVKVSAKSELRVCNVILCFKCALNLFLLQGLWQKAFLPQMHTMTMHIKLLTTARNVKRPKTLHHGWIRTRDLQFWKRTR
jgi:hypothetical protein